MKPVTQRFQVDVHSWNKGLITEASPLNFPEGASIDEENFVLDRDGSRRRRYGIDWEQEFTLTDLLVTTATAAISAKHNFLWENVDEDPEKNILVHQFGNKLYMFDANATACSKAKVFGGPITLTATIAYRFSFANIQGDLIVATGDQTIRRISWESTDSYTIATARLKVRDFWGLDDGLAVNQRTSQTFSSTVGGLHCYNLYNQGWPIEFFCATENTPNPTEMNNGVTTNPLTNMLSIKGVYPSNADIIYTAMTFFTNGRKAFFSYALDNVVSGNTPAPKGHYIIDLFDRSQGRKDAIQEESAASTATRFNPSSYIPTDQSTGGIRAIAAYAGRIWYVCSPGETGGDSQSPHVGTFVLFSKLVDNEDDIGKCYQEADPTAEDISDLIDTDGGYIQIPDAVNLKAIVPFKSSLLVFADNGVWEIAGGDRGFTATEYQTRFLTNNGALNAESIVVIPDAVMYWSRTGIYAIMLTDTGTSFQSLTENTIQSLYNDIPYTAKMKAVGYYDDVSYRVRWLYQETYVPFVQDIFTHELILDTSIPAWSRFEFFPVKANSPYVSGYVPVPYSAREGNADYKYSAFVGGVSGTCYTCIAHLWNTDFRDWKRWDITDAYQNSSVTSTLSAGVDAPAYLVTGYIL